jgi:hypothetical protein
VILKTGSRGDETWGFSGDMWFLIFTIIILKKQAISNTLEKEC